MDLRRSGDPRDRLESSESPPSDDLLPLRPATHLPLTPAPPPPHSRPSLCAGHLPRVSNVHPGSRSYWHVSLFG
ncbi:hypothetical protein E2C01_070593 [Portunus trituberculatus]|uniref:Uncharacterized protein n=1 Tax=Portunus trituberculatus TaxID=210409 RepID=A0A5B7I5P3_PORTR|nr:hypothetical protein [Portunus trituberculatus]